MKVRGGVQVLLEGVKNAKDLVVYFSVKYLFGRNIIILEKHNHYYWMWLIFSCIASLVVLWLTDFCMISAHRKNSSWPRTWRLLPDLQIRCACAITCTAMSSAYTSFLEYMHSNRVKQQKSASRYIFIFYVSLCVNLSHFTVNLWQAGVNARSPLSWSIVPLSPLESRMASTLSEWFLEGFWDQNHAWLGYFSGIITYTTQLYIP